jgi:hypothetical protein
MYAIQPGRNSKISDSEIRWSLSFIARVEILNSVFSKPIGPPLWYLQSFPLQEVLGRTDRVLSIDTTLAA